MQASDIISSVKNNSNVARGRVHARDTGAQVSRQKRQKQELAYAAATIEEALEQAGRPVISTKTLRRERALPPGSVDLTLAKVVTSSEHDDSSKASQAANSSDATTEPENEKDVYYKAFYANYSSLLQSTRHYYNISSSSDSKFINDENEKKSESSSSMEGLSSWTPTSSNNDMNNNKEIDNDNRSDELSLDAEGSISDSLSCESVMNKNQYENGAAYSVVG
jgi:hypothetical protein